MRGRWLPVAAAVGVLVAGCGAGQGGAAAAGDDEYIQLLEATHGTAAQINAGEFIEYDVYQGGFTTCMADEGFEYPQRPFMPPEPDGDPSARLGSEWLEPPAGDLDIAESKVAYRFASRDWKGSPYYDLSVEEKQEYNEALDGCLKHEATWTVDSQPQSAYAVRAALRSLIEDIERDLDTDSYGSCMKVQGFAVDSYSDLHGFVWSSMPPSSQAPDAVDGGDEVWQEGVALERAAAQADARCRADIYAEGVARLNSELPAFQERFAEKLAEIPADWAALLAEADRRSPRGRCSVCRVNAQR